MTMTFEKRVTFVNALFNTILSVRNVTPFSFRANQDGTVDMGTFDAKFFAASVPFRNAVTSILENMFSFITLKEFVEVIQEYFKQYNIPTFYAVINTKPAFRNQKYFEKKYYIAECETNKDLEIEVTQIGKKNMKIIGFIAAGERKQEFTTVEEIIPFYINLYVQVLCDIL